MTTATDCKLGYTVSEIKKNFGTDACMKKCKGCPFLTMDDGMITCEQLMNHIEET